jgi:hypothetical protein
MPYQMEPEKPIIHKAFFVQCAVSVKVFSHEMHSTAPWYQA